MSHLLGHVSAMELIASITLIICIIIKISEGEKFADEVLFHFRYRR